MSCRPASALRHLLRSERVEYLMEAHDGMSARLAENAGFQALWASGLAISTVHGLADASALSRGQLARSVETMASATTLPILVDIDTGYGDIRETINLCADLRSAGAAGVCIEDKVFPKVNSFVSAPHQLVSVGDFSRRLGALTAHFRTDLLVVARTESFIAGSGLNDALTRAKAYVEQGAEGIFLQSKAPTSHEIAGFLDSWKHNTPVLIAPNTYDPASLISQSNGGSLRVVWSNHSMRAAYAAIKEVTSELAIRRSVAAATTLATVNEILEAHVYPSEYHEGVTRGHSPGRPPLLLAPTQCSCSESQN